MFTVFALQTICFSPQKKKKQKTKKRSLDRKLYCWTNELQMKSIQLYILLHLKNAITLIFHIELKSSGILTIRNEHVTKHKRLCNLLNWAFEIEINFSCRKVRQIYKVKLLNLSKSFYFQVKSSVKCQNTQKLANFLYPSRIK